MSLALGMLSALCTIDCKELNPMDALHHRKSPSIGGRNPGSERGRLVQVTLDAPLVAGSKIRA